LQKRVAFCAEAVDEGLLYPLKIKTERCWQPAQD
jgi:hypothetical protein